MSFKILLFQLRALFCVVQSITEDAFAIKIIRAESLVGPSPNNYDDDNCKEHANVRYPFI